MANGGPLADHVCWTTGTCRCDGVPSYTCDNCGTFGAECHYCTQTLSTGGCTVFFAAVCSELLRVCGDEVGNGTCGATGSLCLDAGMPVILGQCDDCGGCN